VHLRAVKLRGFKSFPDAVEVRLEPGVGVIVGPNGSGKSNVADAIRWAAGSLSPSELRAEKPDDVLFGGAANRGAADFCEVELLFDNADGDGPVDYSELSIARRLHRGGEGQYLLNRTAVRRLDLIEILADLGLGQGMHSIIGQGKVEAILSSKPEERRALIEEAAGLGRFKARRHRAELKLTRVATQVERARDLEDEVKKRLRPLALQATAAERAEKLRGEIAKLRARIAELDLETLDERTQEAEERKSAATLARRAAEEKLDAVLEERGRAEEELADAAGKRESAMQVLYRLRSAAERLSLRRESSASFVEGVRAELADAESDAGQSPAEVAQLELVANERAEAARVAAVEREARYERARQALRRLLAAERALRGSAQEKLDVVLARRAEIEAELTGAAGERESALSVSYELRRQAARLAVQRESAQRLIQRLSSELAEAEEDARRGGPSPEQLEQEALHARAAARDAAHARDTLAERARTAQERLATLVRALAERVGIPPAARALVEQGERLALQLLDVEPGDERAVAAALGARASALVAPTAQAALELLERAAATGLGSLRVLAGRDPKELVAELPVVEQHELLQVTVPSVTREGYGYDPQRGELWFAGETAEAVLLELEARRASLAAEASQLGEQARLAERAAEIAEGNAARAETAFAAVAPRLRIRRLDVETLRALVGAAKRLERALAELDGAVDVIEAPLRARGEAGAERTAALGVQLRELGEQENVLRRELAAAVDGAAAAERDLSRLGGSVEVEPGEGDAELLRMECRTLVDEADAAAAEAAALGEEARRAEAARIDAAVRAGRRRARPHQLARVLAGAERLDATLAGAADAAARFEAPLRAQVDAGGARTGQLGEELRRLGAAEVELRQELTNASASVSAIDVELARIEAEADEARRRLEHSGTDERAEGDDRDELAATAERLERRREQLGAVNPLAKEEYEAEKVRLEELSTQRADLEQSLQELEKLRDELTETVETRFTETFAAVQTHFAEVAGTLFPGGEGRLELLDPEDEESQPGIEVHLRPAGKKVQRLSLLSGGEKSLGAISFLFALFLARPCPFYLLDEVEAALDDTNIGRFVALLRQYSDRAQFVVITHQKRTMEAADVLYGVTMGGDGVSQIVSRRLPREEAEAVSAA
jgi:chromosome segregation protein